MMKLGRMQMQHDLRQDEIERKAEGRAMLLKLGCKSEAEAIRLGLLK